MGASICDACGQQVASAILRNEGERVLVLCHECEGAPALRARVLGLLSLWAPGEPGAGLGGADDAARLAVLVEGLRVRGLAAGIRRGEGLGALLALTTLRDAILVVGDAIERNESSGTPAPVREALSLFSRAAVKLARDGRMAADSPEADTLRRAGVVDVRDAPAGGDS